MDGFEVGEREIPTPAVRIEDVTRDRLMQVIAAIISGHTPEEIAGFLDGKFPAAVERFIDRPHEAEEMSAHVDLMLGVIQSAPAPAAVG
jgi:hypothetical protein